MTNLDSIFKSRDIICQKGPSSQGYGFSSGHVWMWELDSEESWAPKNWCFWTVVLEKALESPMDCSMPEFPITISQSLLKFISIEWVMPSSPLILCHPLLLLPPFPLSIRVFSNESVLHTMWPKYWNFSFIISPSSEYSGLISFRMDWFDLLAVQRPLKSLIQHHSSKASILRCSAFFIVQLSHPCMTTEKP